MECANHDDHPHGPAWVVRQDDNDPDLACKNKYLGPIPPRVSDDD